ncbi:VOC family protein [Specibacter cremeus]|uniref:VOC family protein n=1 Tax=Specibacter cremeus TaxID=1629051 RepID=UPI000F79E12F|nr:VOC family protein [Specibacter cremeus]
MATNDIPVGAPCWIDLITSDLAGAKSFYHDLFGWTYETGDEEKYGGYVMAFKDGLPAAGLMQNPGTDDGYSDMWSTYLRVANLDDSVASVTANGGVVYMPPMDVPEQGRMAMLGDAAGASFGLWEFGGHEGFQAHDISGAAGWHELHTKDYPAAVAFYQKALGWQTSVVADSADFRYTSLGEGPAALAGIYDAAADLPDAVPSNWQVYFQVDDTDATIAKAVAGGATVVVEAEDTPFGRIAGLTDPTGAMFKLTQPPAQ